MQMKNKVFNIIKKIVASALFLSILFATLVQLSYLFRYEEKERAGMIINHFYAEDKNTIDVAWVGSSGIYRYFIPSVMYHESGVTSTIFAYPAMPFEVSEFAVDEIEKTQSPKLYVIELRRLYNTLYDLEMGDSKKGMITTKKHHISGLLSTMPVSLNRAKIINKTVTQYIEEDELDWQFEFMRTHYNWENLSAENIETYLDDHIFKRDEYKQKSKNKYKISYTTNKVKPQVKPDLASFTEERTVEKDFLEPLDSLIKYIKKHNLNALFITTPYPISDIANAYETAMENYLKEQEMAYLDCNEYFDEIGLDFSTDFYDDKHTNLAGSIKFSKFVSAYLCENFGLKPTELDEKNKNEWENAYTLWYDEVATPGLKKIKEAKK